VKNVKLFIMRKLGTLTRWKNLYSLKPQKHDTDLNNMKNSVPSL